MPCCKKTLITVRRRNVGHLPCMLPSLLPHCNKTFIESKLPAAHEVWMQEAECRSLSAPSTSSHNSKWGMDPGLQGENKFQFVQVPAFRHHGQLEFVFHRDLFMHCMQAGLQPQVASFPTPCLSVGWCFLWTWSAGPPVCTLTWPGHEFAGCQVRCVGHPPSKHLMPNIQEEHTGTIQSQLKASPVCCDVPWKPSPNNWHAHLLSHHLLEKLSVYLYIFGEGCI